jgi:lysophospholipase L1-like esterase
LAKKPPSEFRVFSLGESTTQGNPWTIETSFSTWLEISLQAAEPSRTFEVVNCGGISYASYRLVPILEEVLRYQPDLIIVCVGHNEFLERRTLEHVESRGAMLNVLLDAASRLRTFALMREGYLRVQGVSSAEPPAGRPILPTEVEALLDYRGGLETYHREVAHERSVIAQYRFNLRRMVELCRASGVELILINPVSNFCDSPPFKSQHRADLSAAERAEWESLCERAREHLHGENYNVHEAARLFEQACRIDPLYAGAFYNLAQCYQAAGKVEQAREAYLRAKDLDVCPLRALGPMNDAVLEMARDTGTALVDAQQLIQDRSADGIVGGDWLVDHVHPSIEGHQLLADALAEKLVALGKVFPRGNWDSVKRERYREHFDSLDNLYFFKGEQRLSALMNWAQGRAKRLPSSGDEAEPADKK